MNERTVAELQAEIEKLMAEERAAAAKLAADEALVAKLEAEVAVEAAIEAQEAPAGVSPAASPVAPEVGFAPSKNPYIAAYEFNRDNSAPPVSAVLHKARQGKVNV